MIIDGSYGEGGGQIVRTALSMSAVRRRPIQILNIRQGRSRPGLQAQHVTAVRALAAITNAETSGARLGSTALRFQPSDLTAGDYQFDVSEIRSSAGAVGLVFQAVAPPLFLASRSSRLELTGGTHVPWSPSTTYLHSVFLPILSQIGCRCRMETVRWGWYPRGGGIAQIHMDPIDQMEPVSLMTPGDLSCVACISAVSNLPRSIADRQRNQVMRRLEDLNVPVDWEVIEAPSTGKGSYVFILAQYQRIKAGFGALGAPGKPAERVADEAVDEFLSHHNSGAAVDKHLADQIILYLALSRKNSSFTTSEVTRHLLTNIRVIEQFEPATFEIRGELGRPGSVTVDFP